MKNHPPRFITRFGFLATTLLGVVIVSLGGAHTAFAANISSTATGGNWSATGTWVGGVVPGSGDNVTIASGATVTVDIAAAASSITYATNPANNIALIISGTNTLTVTNALAMSRPQSGHIATLNVGAGTVSAGSLSMAATTISGGMRTDTVTISTGTMTVAGAITLSGTTGDIFTFTDAGTLNVGGTVSTGPPTFNEGIGTMNYNGAGNQTIWATAYNNLILDGSSGTKSIPNGTSVVGNLSIAPSGTAKASIGAGLLIAVNSLTLGGLGRINGTWGSTSSTATYKNNTYFAATTGRLNVATDTRITPTLSVTNSPVTYDGLPHAATVSASVPGTVSNVLTGGAASQTNAGTYAVTANFTPTDITIHKSLTGASAGNFVINQASQTITFDALPDKTFGEPDFVISATASSGLTVSFESLTTGVCTVSTATVHLVSVGTCTIRASQAGNGNYTAAPTVNQSFAVVGGPPTSLSLNNPGDMYAKTRLGYTVTRHDAFGNAVGTGTTTVYLYSSSASASKKFYNDSLAGSVITSIDIVPGHSTANFWYYDEAPGTYTITASDATPTPDGPTGLVDATDSVVVMPVATKFVILPPTNGTVDAPITVTVQAQKPDNSVDTNYQNDVTLNTGGSATGGGVIDIINGVGAKNISDAHAETVNLSLTDSQSTGLDVSSTQSVVFAGGATAQFVLSHPATVAAGQRAAYTVTRQDQYGNLTATATTTVYLYSSSTNANKKFYDAASDGTVITSIQIPSGQSSASVWYYDELAGTWNITASDNASAPNGDTGINDAVDTLVVTAGPVSKFVINDPGNMTAGTRLEYTIGREDQFNNAVTAGATAAHFYSDSSGPTGNAEFYAAASGGSPLTTLDIPDGQSSLHVWYFDPNTGGWTVTVSDSASGADGDVGIDDASDAVTVNAAPIVATRFVIENPTDGTVDAPITITVKAVDNNGNVDASQNTGVTLTTDGSATGGGLVTISSGVGTTLISDHLAETVNLGLVDSQTTHLDVSSTQNALFAPGAVAHLSLNNPGDVAAGARIGYIVSRTDQYGNAVTSGATTVNLSSSSTGVNKKFYDAASGGSAITFIVIPNSASSIGFWAYDEKAGNWFITAEATGIGGASDPIAVQPGATAKFFFLDDPGNMTAGTRLGYAVTREDQFNNLVTAGVTLAYLYSSSTGTTTAFYSTVSGGAPTAFAAINDGSSSGNFWYYDNTPGTWLVTASDSTTAPPNGSAGIQDAVDSVTVSAIPIVATRFVIVPPVSVQVGTPATVTIEAQDDAGNIDTTIQSGVTLHATGSATGAGLVTMVNGVGSIVLQDTIAETVTLSLSDTQTTHLNVASTQSLVFSATPVAPVAGGAGGMGARIVPNIIGVQLSGRAFPGAQVQILAASPQGTNVQGQTTASADGTFNALLSGVGVGASAYGLVGVDPLGRTTQIKTFNASYASPNTLLDISSVLLSPTVGLVHPTVRKNDVVGFVGYAMPNYRIFAQVDGKMISQTDVADADGSYKILYPTGSLNVGSHTVRVQQVSPAGLRSDFTPQKVFNVTMLLTPQTDFNQDGVINVQDWSIFLSRFTSANAATRMLDDLNGDGKVDVTDLSIFVRTLKQ